MAEIKDIKARSILDSRGFPTVEVDIILSNGLKGTASVPSGASTGSREAVELRDGGKPFSGKGVETAIKNIQNEIKPALLGHDVRHQKSLDDILIRLDGSENKSQLGANAILAVSIAAARSASKALHLPLYQHLRHINPISSDKVSEVPYLLPMPLINIINGGAHASNSLDIQEFMIIPVGASTFREAISFGVEVFHALKSILKKQGLPVSVGDEGGFAPDLATHEAAIELILSAITDAGLQPGKEIALGLDLASSEFYSDKQYHFKTEKKSFDSEQFATLLKAWIQDYPIISIEDGMAEEDWAGWKLLTDKIGDACQLVGDDLFVTNTKIFNRGITEGIANAILIKPNQIGTLTETFAAINLARAHHYATVISHRSGETEDTLIADLAVATNAGQIKTGSMSRGERTVKYNQLLRIEEELGKNAKLLSFSQKNN